MLNVLENIVKGIAWAVLAAAVLCTVYLAMLRGRRSNRLRASLSGWVYAHRGYHSEPDAPENSREAFRRAAARGFGAELDVHLLADGGLAVIHDSHLQRMTGLPGDVEDLTVPQLAGCRLGASRETIPQFSEVLAIYGGRAPLIIELKTRGRNYAALCRAVCRALEGYPGLYCLESFDPRVVRWLRRNRPDVLRGQLSNNFLRDRCGLPRPVAFLATYLLCNLLTRPDFIAYKFEDRRNLSNWLCLHLWKLQGASWTLRSEQDLETARHEGLWPIFENFDPAA